MHFSNTQIKKKKRSTYRPSLSLGQNSGVTPMGSGWANPRAPGLRGHPQGAAPFHSSAPPKIAL